LPKARNELNPKLKTKKRQQPSTEDSRLLLHHVTGAKCWDDLKRVPGEEQPRATFREACLGRDLLESDEQWHSCLTEAASIERGSGMRNLFAIILTESNPGNHVDLWEQHKDDFCDDCEYRLREKFGIPMPSDEQVYSLGLQQQPPPARRRQSQISGQCYGKMSAPSTEIEAGETWSSGCWSRDAAAVQNPCRTLD
jgi:hypothetical protein